MRPGASPLAGPRTRGSLPEPCAPSLPAVRPPRAMCGAEPRLATAPLAMKVLIVGGYGVFGGRLARLLLADGCEVWVAGRDLGKALTFAARHGGKALRLDVTGDLSPIAAATPDFVVDASGAFKAKNCDPYRL